MPAIEAAFSVPNIQAVYFLSDGEVYDDTTALVETTRRLSLGHIHCHTTAFFAEPSGQELLREMAEVTGGEYLNFQG